MSKGKVNPRLEAGSSRGAAGIERDNHLKEPDTLTVDEANQLVLEHQGWAESIARSVARSWNMDWQLDGLDGAAMEALIFCARRYQPTRGVPFRGYARKRIHEASTDQARRSKGWKRGLGTSSKSDQISREISAELLNVFPELRMGMLPYDEGATGSDGDMRSAVRTLLVGASIVAAKQGITTSLPDEVLDYKRMIEMMATLEPIHQLLLWKTYWEGQSMRTVATEWETDELNVIREHKALLAFLQKSISNGKAQKMPKVRPGLRQIALKMKKESGIGTFTQLLKGGAAP